jgi:hypothetical protein
MTMLTYIIEKKEYLVAILLPFFLFLILSPGVLFEITPYEETNIVTKNKIPYKTAIIHATVFSTIMAAAIYYTFMYNKVTSF